MKKTTRNVRLSSHVVPVKYTIHFEPDLDNFTFTGKEEVLLDIKKETSFITLHSAEIEIFEAKLIQNKNTQVGSITYRDKDEEVTLNFLSKISPGKVTLKLSFAGILNDKMRGFYRSKYVHAGKEYHMGVTQFESTDARRAFPCIDEPASKAVFEVSFKVPSDRTVISNTIESEVIEHESGYRTVKFSPSPKMSPYLLAFIIGHFEYISGKTKDGTLVRVFVTPGKKKQAEFALDTAVKCLEFYTSYFKIKYPLPTMDLIAIPDFAAGAMENWGAVTYRETALLVDPLETSTHNKQWVALVIAHELAHQWFGNLVTMEWWTHLWLNEGFASYIEYLAVDKLFPQWNVWTQFVHSDHASALSLDGLANTHPIEIEVSHPAEISEIFDEVSYSKGASVIRMLAEFLGEKNFRNGLRLYLKKHSYANAKTEDLWKALETVSKLPVSKTMKNWTGKPGYPLVSISENKDQLELTQRRFFSSVFSQKTKDNTVWQVPLSIVSKESSGFKKFLLDKKNQLLQLPEHSLHSWIKLNKNETSFARVKYSSELLFRLKKPIEDRDKKLSEQDRFGIIRDVFSLSEAGYTSTDLALTLSCAYKNDTSYIVWASLTGDMYQLLNLLAGDPLEKKFKLFVLDLFKNIGKEVGWEKKKHEDHNMTLLRPIVLGVLGRFGDAATIKKAQELFNLDKSGKKKLPADLRGLVYVLVSENGSKSEYEYFMKRYIEEDFQEEKDRLLRALCAPKNKALLSRSLDFSFTDQVKAQDSFKVISMVWGNHEGRYLAWEKLQKEWSGVVKKFGGGHLYSRFVKPGANFVSEKDAAEFEKFFKTHESKGIERTIQQVLEQVRSNAAWLARDKEKIHLFLDQRS